MRSMLVAALLGGLGVVAAPLMVSAQVAGDAGGDTEVRIVARRVAGERIEFALQERGASGVWGERLLPAQRLFPVSTRLGRWLSSSPLVVISGDSDGPMLPGTETQLRIVARRVSGGRVEFALQERGASGVWGERLLPAQRLFPLSTRLGRWLSSSPLTVRPAPGEDLPGRASVVAVGGEGTLAMRWSASAGSSPIVHWENAGSYTSGGWSLSRLDGGTKSLFWSDQPVGLYRVRVRACNAFGCGPWGSDSTTVLPVPAGDLPGRASVVAVGGEGTLAMRWSASAGSSPIVRWELSGLLPGGDDFRSLPSDETGITESGQPEGLHVVRVRACSAFGCGPRGSDSATVLPVGGLTPATLQLRAWAEEFVGRHEAAHPWLRMAWDHIRDHTFLEDANDASTDDGYVVPICPSHYGDRLYTETLDDFICRAAKMVLRSQDTDVLVHELAHVYDFTIGLASDKMAWGAVQLYFWMTYSDCKSSSALIAPPNELLADTVKYVFDPSKALRYYQPGVLSEGCLDRAEPSPEAVAVVRAGLEGRVPKWYIENFSNGAELWAAIRPLLTGNDKLLANLAHEFGGLCSWGSTDLLSLWDSRQHNPAEGANPFRDGGCGS